MTVDQPNPHDPVPFREVSEPTYAHHVQTAFTLVESAGGAYSLRGPCPRCRGVTVALLDIRHVMRSSGSRSARTSVEHHMCECPLEHPGRPDGIPGCGAYWNIEVEQT